VTLRASLSKYQKPWLKRPKQAGETEEKEQQDANQEQEYQPQASILSGEDIIQECQRHERAEYNKQEHDAASQFPQAILSLFEDSLPYISLILCENSACQRIWRTSVAISYGNSNH
jgi:hypothetical protein